MIPLMIVQPYVPTYRVPFFRALRTELASAGVDMVLAACTPQGPIVARGDDATVAEADMILKENRIPLGRKSIGWRRLNAPLKQVAPDYVVVEQAIKNFENYPLLARSKWKVGPQVAMWGHGRTYSTHQSLAETRLKEWLTRQADWFFAYTAAGAKQIVSHGFDKDRVTILNNTIDTAHLANGLANITKSDEDNFRRIHGLTKGQTGLFIGGVDEHKGIGFLLESAIRIEKTLPGFVLLVGGSGTQTDLVVDLERRGGPVRYLGRLDGFGKALALTASDLMLIPQWVGLVAVDSLVAGTPIVTTRHASHSSEFEYLSTGVNSVVCDYDVSDYVNTVVATLQNAEYLSSIRLGALRDASSYSMTGMTENFVNGVLRWVGQGG